MSDNATMRPFVDNARVQGHSSMKEDAKQKGEPHARNGQMYHH